MDIYPPPWRIWNLVGILGLIAYEYWKKNDLASAVLMGIVDFCLCAILWIGIAGIITVLAKLFGWKQIEPENPEK